jgi:hypothetical protein
LYGLFRRLEIWCLVARIIGVVVGVVVDGPLILAELFGSLMWDMLFAMVAEGR